ncbi:MAG: CCA tRNA nucleotidyltransferase [bacterium]
MGKELKLKPRLVAELSEAGQLYEVGGTVRDRLLPDLPEPKDLDFLVTGIPFRRLCDLLRHYGRVDLVGRFFGVIKFTQPANGTGPGGTFDFVLPRKEVSTGAGHRDFEVSFDHTLAVEDDLQRRDFTINAIARDVVSGEFVDPLHGRADIEKKLIRFTSPQSFVEDPLRMLRAVQFAARLEFDIEAETYQAIVDNARMITTVSPERVAEELNKLLTRAKQPSIGFKLMQQTGLLKHLLPELEDTVGVTQPGPYHAHPVFEHSIYAVDAAPPRLLVRMATLLHDITKPQAKRVTGEESATFYGHEVSGSRQAGKVLRRLRYSNDFIDEVSRLVEKHMFTSDLTDKALRRLIRRVTPELIFDLLDLRRADVVGQGMGGNTDDVDELEQRIREELERKPPFGLNDLAVNGDDLMKVFGLPEGRQIGEVLNQLLEMVLDYPEKNEYELLIEAARDYLGREDLEKGT